jgi:hypothetical protein
MRLKDFLYNIPAQFLSVRRCLYVRRSAILLYMRAINKGGQPERTERNMGGQWSRGRGPSAPFPPFSRRSVLDVQQKYASGARHRKITENPSKLPPAEQQPSSEPLSSHSIRAVAWVHIHYTGSICVFKGTYLHPHPGPLPSPGRGSCFCNLASLIPSPLGGEGRVRGVRTKSCLSYIVIILARSFPRNGVYF